MIKKSYFNNLFVVFLIILCILFCLAACDNSYGLEYSINADNKTCTITGIGNYNSIDVIIPEKIGQYTVVAISDNAFAEYNIISVSLPNTIERIGKGAFSYCSHLERINIPPKVTVIEEGTFTYCTSLKSIELPEGITRINESAFQQCDSITSIVFPSTLTYIGVGAFLGCNSLSELVLPEGLKEIDRVAFAYCESLSEANIPASVESIYISFVCCASLESINVDSRNTHYISIDGVLYDHSKTILKGYPSGKIAISFTVPAHVISIDLWAFSENEHLQEIYLSSNVQKINDHMIYNCHNLKSINYNDTVVRWYAIHKRSEWDKYTDDYTIYCTDGQISKNGTVTYN